MTRRFLRSRLAALALLGAAGPGAAQPLSRVRSHAPVMLDTRRIAAARFGNDAPWYADRIPFFESADPRIDAVYYYRWALFRAHQRDLGERGFISTEFLDDVSWQLQPWASLNDATGFHLGEGRWLRDRRYADDYIAYMYEGGNDRHFTDYMADSVWGRYLVDGDTAAATRHLPAMRRLYAAWDDHLDRTKGLYWVEPLLDATEYTISSIDASGGKDGFRGGDAFRPSINSYMFANAAALGRLSALAGKPADASSYAALAAAIKARMQAALWNDVFDHFVDRYKVSNQYVTYWEPIRGRELVGMVPWMFDLPDDTPRFVAAWNNLLRADRLAGPMGMRTVEPSYQYYMRQYRYEGTKPECQWNGPVWPFQTTQVLLGMANLLDHYKQARVTRSDYMRLLRQYTQLHYQGDRLDLEEDYHPNTGQPIVGLARSHHYFHSGYADLILGGLVGIRPQAGDVLEVNPLLPAAGDPQALAWFRAQNIPYHGHRIGVTWDADGWHYRRGRGLAIDVDGRVVARRATLGRLRAPLARVASPPIMRPIARSIQLVRGTYPLPSASTGTDPEQLHDAIDGRVWFFPELPNGWDAPVSRSGAEQWFAINFGHPTRLDRAEIAFASTGTIAAPATYRLQAWLGSMWRDLPGASGHPTANGITNVRFAGVTTDRVRLVFTPNTGHATRLVELKLF